MAAVLIGVVMFIRGNENYWRCRVTCNMNAITKRGCTLGGIVEPIEISDPSEKVEVQFFTFNFGNFIGANISIARNMWPQKELLGAENARLGQVGRVVMENEIRRHLPSNQEIVDAIFQVGRRYLAYIVHFAPEFKGWGRWYLPPTIFVRRGIRFPARSDLDSRSLTEVDPIRWTGIGAS